jgi:broad specificity phosphatase PhoE
VDRDFAPAGGQSSRQAGERLLGFLADLPAGARPVAAVTHGGVTVDLLRTLLGDGQLPAGLLAVGVPPGAITVIEDLDARAIASTAHL